MSRRVPAAVEAELAKVASLIATARRMLAESRIVDLSALEAKVRTLCDALLAAPAETRETLHTEVSQVIADLDRLGEELTRQNEAVTAQMARSASAMALRAYRRTGGDGHGT